MSTDPLGFVASLSTGFTFSRSMTGFIACMETTWKECTAYLTARYSVLGTSNILDGGIFTAGASSRGEIRARRTCFGFMAWVSGFRVAASGWRSGTSVLAVDRGAATSQPTIRLAERSKAE